MPFDPVDDIRLRIIDSAVDLTTRAEAIRLAGIKTVIRYYARGPGQWDGKVLSKPELDALETQNLSVAVVFQQDNHEPELFLDENKKVEDLKWARTHADHLQQPERHADLLRRRLRPAALGRQEKKVRSEYDRTAGRVGQKLFRIRPRGTRQGRPQARRLWLRPHLRNPGRRRGLLLAVGVGGLLASGAILQFRKMAPVPEPHRSDSGYYDHPKPCPIDANSGQSGPRGFRPVAARRQA